MSGSASCAQHSPQGARCPNPRPGRPARSHYRTPITSTPSYGPLVSLPFTSNLSTEPIEFGRDADDAFNFAQHLGIVKGLTKDLDEATRAVALDAVHETLRQHETRDGVLLGTAASLTIAHHALLLNTTQIQAAVSSPPNALRHQKGTS